jgi:hypothetical protein
MIRELLSGSVNRLLRLAAFTALVALVVMCASLLVPRALPVIFAMSVGHVIGVSAVGCYLLAIVIDARRLGRERRSLPPSDSSPIASERR